MSEKNSVRQQSIAQRKYNFENNPCFEEQMQSLKCIEINSNDSEKCLRQFENVKMCKTFWYEIIKFRKQNSIFPHLPNSHERLLMKQKYLKTGSVKPVIEDMKQEFNL
jgi:hypothetical protein